MLFSETEGEDKPLKYLTILNTGDLAAITKLDLAGAVSFDDAAARRNIQAVRPGTQIIKVSAKTGAGLAVWIGEMESRWAAARRRAVVTATLPGGHGDLQGNP